MSVILVGEREGVYLGSFLGLGIWSQLDSAGQDAAVVFPSADVAWDTVQTWDGKDGLSALRFLPVEADLENGRYASERACIAAGAKPWSHVLN